MVVLEITLQVLAGIGIVALLFLVAYAWTLREVIRGVRCEVKNKFVLTTFIVSPFHKAYLDVASCSAFAEGEPFDCGKRCLKTSRIYLKEKSPALSSSKNHSASRDSFFPSPS